MGNLGVSVSAGQRDIVLRSYVQKVPPFNASDDEWNTMSVGVTEVRLEMKRRQVEISETAMQMSGAADHYLRAHNVPLGDPTLEMEIRADMHTTRYIWRCAIVTPELLEQIFDMPEFEPC